MELSKNHRKDLATTLLESANKLADLKARMLPLEENDDTSGVLDYLQVCIYLEQERIFSIKQALENNVINL